MERSNFNSRAVLLSVQPTWCELILSRKKILELRKSRPKIDLPFRCYIYCTSGNLSYCKHVVAEFICDRIDEVAVSFIGGNGQLKAVAGNEVWHGGLLEFHSCLSTEEISRYIGGISGKGYAWHISDLQIYDTLKYLQSFTRTIDRGDGFLHSINLQRPPQSWCYVNELKHNIIL